MEIESLKALWDILTYAFMHGQFYAGVFGSILIFAVILYVVRTLITIIRRLKGA